MTNNPSTSRPKDIPPSQRIEEAGESLQLGEMQEVDTLTVSEAALVVNALLSKRGVNRNALQHNESVNRRFCAFLLLANANMSIFGSIEFCNAV